MADFTGGRTYPDLNRYDTKTRFEGYVVLVAGGCDGIGRAAVERFASDGATVYALDLNVKGEEDMQALFGTRVKCIELDIADNARCREVAAEIAQEHDNTIHTLFNCAAFFGGKDLNIMNSDWKKSFDVNVIGYANMVQAVEPFMRKGNYCSIIHMASVRGHDGMPMGWNYSASKGAVLTMTKCMANDLKHKHIRVNSISPATCWTNPVARVYDYQREPADADWAYTSFSGRLGEVEEVAGVVTFLASKDANYVNGADIPVDDGFLAMGVVGKGERLSKFAG